MNRREHEPLNDLPSMAPARDEVSRRKTPQASLAKGGGSGGLLSILALLIGITALGAAYFLYEQSLATHAKAELFEQRVQVLEGQLASTGDELSESDAAVRVRMKELDLEVRKLWDDRKKKLAEDKQRDKKVATQEKQTVSLGKKYSSSAAQLTALSAQVDEMAEILDRADLGTIEKNIADAKASAAKLTRDFAALEKRVKANEEWVESVNVFRRQVNQRLNQIQNPASPAPVLR
ncbi:MAG: hypothetical protein HKO84_09465 [Pseudomonadales bacterium]|nr:hypothetical protein [Pseudomonadales bacterium]